MPTGIERLAGVRLKIARARRHIEELDARIKSFRESSTDLLGCNQDQSGDLSFILQRELPAELPIIIGDALHNLRTSLDHLVCRLVDANGQLPTRKNQFPIYSSPVDYQQQNPAKLAGVNSATEPIFAAVQPFHSGNEFLAQLSELNNADKHRVLVVVAYHVCGFKMTWQSPLLDQIPGLKDTLETMRTEHDAPLADDATSSADTDAALGTLGVGEELAVISWPGGPPIDGGAKLRLHFNVVFDELGSVKGEEVVSFLSRLSLYVENLVNRFIPFLS